MWSSKKIPLKIKTDIEKVLSLWKTAWRFLKKLKIELPHDPAFALLVIYPKGTNLVNRRDTYAPMFIIVMSTIAKLWKEPRCPSTDEWIKKMWYFIYIYTHILTHTHT